MGSALYSYSYNAVIPWSTRSCMDEPPSQIQVVNQPHQTSCLDHVCLVDNGLFWPGQPINGLNQVNNK